MIVPHKKAFSMLTAIVVIVAMALIASYVASTAGKTVKMTTDQYRKEQAMFYAKSYTEYAIMAVSARDRVNQDCIDDIDAIINQNGEDLLANNGRGLGYRIRVRISYIGDPTINNCAATRRLSNAVIDSRTPLNIVVDVYVDYNDINDNRPDDATSNGAGNGELRHLTYHRRSLQKI